MPAPYTTGFLGMRGTGDWSAQERPESWRETILKLFPNGAAPLTAIMSKLKSEKVDDPHFNWFQKDLAAQGGAVAGIYIDSGLVTLYARATHYNNYGTAGKTLYVKVDESVANHFRKGHQCVLRDGDRRTDVDVQAHVADVTKAGVNSYLTVMLLENDDNSVNADLYNLGTADEVWITGNAQSEGATIPDSIAYDPTPLYNYTQIFMTALSITRTAKKTRLRTADAYLEAKVEALQYHSIELEQAFIFGERYLTTGSNGKPLRFTRGIVNWVRNEGGIYSDYQYDTSYSGKTWLQAGEDWIEDKLETIKRWNDQREILGLCGSGFLRAINALAKQGSQMLLEPTSAAYGLQVTRWVSTGLTVNLIDHPLFNHRESDRRKCVIFDPRRLVFRYIDDTTFLKDPGEKVAGYVKRDSTDEMFLTEAGLELHHPKSMALLDGAGLNNVV